MEGVAVSGATSSSKYAAKLVTGCGGSPSSEVRRMISEAKLDNETLLTVVKKLEEQVSLLRVQLETAAEQARQDLREARLEARQREERLIADNLQLREELRKERELLTTLVAQSIGHNQPLQQQQGVASTSGAQRGGQAQQRQRKIKLDAIEVAPAEGQSWDEVYQLVRAAPELQRFNSQLGVGRRTMRSRLVMDVEKGADTAAILKCVQEVCARGDQPAAARLVTPMVEVRVDAIDPLAKEQDVALALASLAQSPVEESAVQLRKAWNGTKVAFVRVPEKAAEQLKDRHVLIKLVRTNEQLAEVQRQIGVGKRTPNDTLKLPLSRDVDSEELCQRIRVAIGELGEASVRTEMSQVLVTNIDCLADEQQLRRAMLTELGKEFMMATIDMWERRDGTKRARVRLPRKDAEHLAGKRLLLGYTSCSVWEVPKTPLAKKRCFRCLERGHFAEKCSGADRSKACIRCGVEGHKAMSCTADVCCLKCGGPHQIGSASCNAAAERSS
ncbi:uncharacterized protein LOC128308608 [Anopheles moucheti]|uniref:uncharacterized protein LOC128308608 n=1 Tax=Anopheles moucheti TaxID=186751 RepID=UPI0022F0C47C|nr:uncharacterized protein LOC128308608 [Anopheles moucheti]